MKQFIAMTAGLLLTGVVLESHAIDEGMETTCRLLHQYSTEIMKARQRGVDMPRVMDTASGDKLVEEIIIRAYSHPRYTTQEYRQRSIEDFANDVYRGCREYVKSPLQRKR